MTDLVLFFLIFLVVGAGFLMVNLIIGRIVRPSRPSAEKETIYECGEPTVGSSWIQFDLRFYVVALLFVIFDVELAFFFPWSTVFGTSTKLAKEDVSAEERARLAKELVPDRPPPPKAEPAPMAPAGPLKTATVGAGVGGQPKGKKGAKAKTKAEPKVVPKAEPPPPKPSPPPERAPMPRVVGEESLEKQQSTATRLAWIAFADILFFFGVLLVGFAYLWKLGDL